jgi:hypothetical protein
LKNLSLRSKLMVITSGLIVISLIVLSVISIRYFAQDKTDLIKLQTNDTAKLIAERLKTEIGAKIEALTVFDRYAAGASSSGSPKKKTGRKKAKAVSSVPQAPMAAGNGVLRVSRYTYSASRHVACLQARYCLRRNNCSKSAPIFSSATKCALQTG